MNDFLIVFLLNEQIYRTLEKCITFLRINDFWEQAFEKLIAFFTEQKFLLNYKRSQ